MGKIEIDLPEHIEMQIAKLIDEGEYMDRQEAVEDLVSIGIKTMRTSGKQNEFDEFEEEFQDTMGGDDEYLF